MVDRMWRYRRSASNETQIVTAKSEQPFDVQGAKKMDTVAMDPNGARLRDTGLLKGEITLK